MRLWSIHPSHLDSKGLVALWREGLLAFHVLSGKTKGYTQHPQLERFKSHSKPLAAITSYLHAVADEADHRGYHFQRGKLPKLVSVEQIKVTTGQLAHETQHLLEKLKQRDSLRYKTLHTMARLTAHPLFKTEPGEIAPWERP